MSVSTIPSKVAAAIETCWPDGVIEEFDTSESYFHSIREGLERDFRKIPGAALCWQTADKSDSSTWRSYRDDDDWDDDPPPVDEPWSSYWIYFLAPNGSAFRFNDEIESPAFDEETGDQLDEEEIYPGEGWTGCAVGISLAARVAAITLTSYSRFEDGSESCPEIDPLIVDEETNERIDPDQSCRQSLPPDSLTVLDQLRDKIAEVLKKHKISTLDPAILDLPVPNLAADGEVFLAAPLRVRDAFFFRGV